MITEVHTHTTFSHDGLDDLETMVDSAKARGVGIYGISEHYDYDYVVCGVRYQGDVPPPITDSEKYFSKGRAVKGERKDIKVLIGAEFGYTDNENAYPMYENIVQNYHPDFIINSVHSFEKNDYSEQPQYYHGGVKKEQREVYLNYLRLVKNSLSAPYPYDIVGHFTYVTRYAPYEDKRMTMQEYGEQIDEILKEIIQKGKILEVNTSARSAPQPFLPSVEILARYYELGGRKVSIGSDAHKKEDILHGRERAVEALKEVGFTCVTVPENGRYTEVEL